VNPRREIRWINEWSTFGEVVLIDPAADNRRSCKNNVGEMFTPSNMARPAPNERAWVKPGVPCISGSGESSSSWNYRA